MNANVNTAQAGNGAGGEHDAVLRRALALLAEGVAEAASPLRYMSFATAGTSAPGLRIMVLRALQADPPALDFHTDARSPKIGALAAEPHASALGWHPGHRVQLRLTGRVDIVEGAEAAAIWRALPASTRDTYSVDAAPGTPIAAPDQMSRSMPHAAALQVFRVLRLRVAELEWLHLAPGQHQRARFTWANGLAQATWLVP